MSEATDDTFVCPSCRRAFRWRAELAGRRTRCRCGALLGIPREPGDATVVEVAAAPPAASAPAAPSVASGAHTSVLREAMSPRASPVERALLEREDDTPENVYVDWIAPLVMLVGGIVVIFGGSMYLAAKASEPVWVGFLSGIVLLGLELFVMMPLLLVSLFLTAHLTGISFGPLFSAVFKLSAICVGPGAVADVLLLVLELAMFALMPFGLFTKILLPFVIYMVFLGVPMSRLFDLELNETYWTVGVAVVVRMLTFVLVISVVMGLMR